MDNYIYSVRSIVYTRSLLNPLCPCTRSASLPHPPPLMFAALGNPPLIRKSVSPRLNAADKEVKLVTLCTREATWVYTGLELPPGDKWVLPGLRFKDASSDKSRQILFSLFLGVGKKESGNGFSCDETFWCDMKTSCFGFM